jgi:hypothetical protein
MSRTIRNLLQVGCLGALLATAHGGFAATIWVAVDGRDDQQGTAERPVATLARAQQLARALVAKGLDADLEVTLKKGVYRLPQTLTFRPEDTGDGAHAVVYTAVRNEPVVVSGGQPIAGWRADRDGTWVAKVPGGKEGRLFTHLWVNGRRATRARTPDATAEPPAWQLSGAELSKDLTSFTLRLDRGRVKAWSHPEDVEVMVAGNWAINRKRVQSVDAATGTAVLAPPHIGGPDYIQPAAGRWCYFENAREMLDRPGEWFLDRHTGLLHYQPLPGEDMTKAEVIAPGLVQLVVVRGDPGRPVRNLHFRGISFEHTDWAIPPGGYQGIQACHYNTAGRSASDWGRVPSALAFTDVERCSVEDGAIRRLGTSGIELAEGSVDNLVQGNVIDDVAGNGVNVGGGVPRGNRVVNNLVRDCGQRFFGAVGIWVGIAEHTTIAHNLIHRLPYSGISVGWEWSSKPTPCRANIIEFNHVYDVMNRLCDGGCIYNLGLQPGTTIRGNHLHDVHRSFMAQGAPNNGMFIDEGSKGFHFERNVIHDTAAEPIRFNQCERDWHTWNDNFIGRDAVASKGGAETIAQARPQSPWRVRFDRFEAVKSEGK